MTHKQNKDKAGGNRALLHSEFFRKVHLILSGSENLCEMKNLLYQVREAQSPRLSAFSILELVRGVPGEVGMLAVKLFHSDIVLCSFSCCSIRLICSFSGVGLGYCSLKYT